MVFRKTLNKYERYAIATSPVKSFLVTAACIIMSIIFITTGLIHSSVRYDETGKISGIWEETLNYELNYEKGKNSPPTIYFVSLKGDTYMVDYCCSSDDLVQNLVSLEKGDKINLAVNPKAKYVLEIKTESGELLNFDSSQTCFEKNYRPFFYLGIIVGLMACYMLVHSVSLVVPKKKKERRKNSERN